MVVFLYDLQLEPIIAIARLIDLFTALMALPLCGE
jgi:hypothetical protein